MRIITDIVATAYFRPSLFERIRPCFNAATGKSNPLKDMSLAKSGGWNILGATYGKTRNGGTKFHNGIDFYGEVGTEVYSMYDGVVDFVVSEQPNRDKDGYLPKSYKGDDDNAGNRIRIISSEGDITLGYWHLQAGNPIAINPRTGKPFAKGDKVYQGELIGYVGRTGNAYNVPIPHLHLNARNSSGRMNPITLVNGTISTTSTIITNIICND